MPYGTRYFLRPSLFLENMSPYKPQADEINRGYLFFSVKDRNFLFHRVDTMGNIFTSGTATSENITDGVHEMK